MCQAGVLGGPTQHAASQGAGDDWWVLGWYSASYGIMASGGTRLMIL